jgi:hypothetical protein
LRFVMKTLPIALRNELRPLGKVYITMASKSARRAKAIKVRRVEEFTPCRLCTRGADRPAFTVSF